MNLDDYKSFMERIINNPGSFSSVDEITSEALSRYEELRKMIRNTSSFEEKLQIQMVLNEIKEMIEEKSESENSSAFLEDSLPEEATNKVSEFKNELRKGAPKKKKIKQKTKNKWVNA